MDAPAPDLIASSQLDARQYMVDGQLRPNKVTDRRILDAMRRLPREAFVPAAMRAIAYADVEIALGHGRFMLPPVTVARMAQAVRITPGDRVLVIGAGFAAALFAEIGAAVTAVDEDAALLAAAAAAYGQAGVAVALQQGPLVDGWAADAPYAAIVVDGGVPRLPTLARQLRRDPAGRLCAVVVGSGRAGQAMLAEAEGALTTSTTGALAARPLFDCTATPMPQFGLPGGFVF